MKNPLILFALSAASAAQAATVVPVDDFTTGHYQSPQYGKGTSQQNSNLQFGSMLGGSRSTSMGICDTTTKGQCAATNPDAQKSSYAILTRASAPRTSQLIQSSGYEDTPRLEVAYGQTAALNQNFAALGAGAVMRLYFTGVTQVLNFNILLFNSAGDTAINGCNLAPLAGAFTVEVPVASFHHDAGFSMSDVQFIDYIFQDGSPIGGVEFGISRLEVSDTSLGNVVTCQMAFPGEPH